MPYDVSSLASARIRRADERPSSAAPIRAGRPRARRGPLPRHGGDGSEHVGSARAPRPCVPAAAVCVEPGLNDFAAERPTDEDRESRSARTAFRSRDHRRAPASGPSATSCRGRETGGHRPWPRTLTAISWKWPASASLLNSPFQADDEPPRPCRRIMARPSVGPPRRHADRRRLRYARRAAPVLCRL